LGVKATALLNVTCYYLLEILWCGGWAAVGVSLGLWSNRYNTVHDISRYFTYFVFVWVIAFLSAFVALGTFEKDIIRSYAAATLAGLIVGFMGDRLPERFKGI
jgi:hypothetical protein